MNIAANSTNLQNYQSEISITSSNSETLLQKRQNEFNNSTMNVDNFPAAQNNQKENSILNTSILESTSLSIQDEPNSVIEDSNYINNFKLNKDTNFSILHLNVSTLLKNIYEIDTILKTNLFDIITLNETKLDNSVPNSFYKNSDYNMIRRDKTKKESGLLVFIKKIHNLIKFDDKLCQRTN